MRGMQRRIALAVLVAGCLRLLAKNAQSAAFTPSSFGRAGKGPSNSFAGGSPTGQQLRGSRVALALSPDPQEVSEYTLAEEASEEHTNHGFAATVVTKANQLVDSGLGTSLLMAGAVVSMMLANMNSVRAPWLNFWNKPFGPPIGGHALSMRAWVNEGLMAFFFFNVGLEIKAELTEGSLKSPSQALMPVVAALGGMVVPMLVYALVNRVLPGGSLSGVTVPMATDIAFAMGVFQAFRAHMPQATGSFLLALATVDDLGAILVIALCFAGAICPTYLWASLGALGCSILLCMRGTEKSARGYFVPGIALWYFMLRSGLCADVAGVLTALCVPMRSKNGEHVVERLIKRWTPVCSLFILPVFALANCAVSFGGGATGAASTMAVPLGVFLGLLLGKPLGIFSFTWGAVKVGWGKLPEGMTTRHLGVVGVLGAIGFTMCLFLIENSLSGPAAQFSKISVFVGSVLGAVVSGFAMSRLPKKEQLLAIAR